MKKIISIKQNSRFQRLYKKGKPLVSPLFVCYIRKVNSPRIFLGITVSKKIGNAVLRNRAKRVIRAAVLRAEQKGLCGCELIMVARTKTPFVKSTRLSEELCSLLCSEGFLTDEEK